MLGTYREQADELAKSLPRRPANFVDQGRKEAFEARIYRSLALQGRGKGTPTFATVSEQTKTAPANLKSARLIDTIAIAVLELRSSKKGSRPLCRRSL